MSIKDRKKDHVSLTAEGDMQYQIPTGFQDYRFRHNALPETDLNEVSTEAPLLGRTFSFPLFVSSMTGGYTEAGAVNAIIAAFCEKHNLPFGVGSQRVMLENPETADSFSIVREKAPGAFIASNIGGAQLIDGLPKEHLNLLIDTIEADAVIVHLNPLQELMQPEGDRNFKGIEEGIAQLVQHSPVPVVVKETGAGISGEVAYRLLEAGVSVIDIAGAGGTSWAKVENERSMNTAPKAVFNDWGIPTLQSLGEVLEHRSRFDYQVMVSGGVRSSRDIAKSFCLGADFTASAQPVIKAIVKGGEQELETLFQGWVKELKIIMTLLGCKSMAELNSSHLDSA